MAIAEEDYSVAVVGGGPAGSSAATTLARAGRSVVVLEKQAFPRYHIGESQLPALNGLLQALGVEEQVAAEGFVEKWGATFLTDDGSVEQYADFTAAADTPEPRACHVVRARFDQLLLDHARSCGAEVLQSAHVQEAVFLPEWVELRFVDAEGRPRLLRSAVVIDASGRDGFLARRFGRRVVDPVLRNVSIHAQYEGVPRADGRRAGDIRLITRPDNGWFWLIPLTEEVTSLGVVVPKCVHDGRPKLEPDEALAAYLAETPEAARLVENAEQITSARVDADFSYLASAHCGDRWLLAGDSGAFLDPIFSTGVALAMQAGIDAAEAVDRALTRGSLSGRAFAAYQRTVQRRYGHFRRIVCAFYDPAFRDLFFSRTRRWGLYEALLSVLAGNWKPSLLIRVRLALFFALVALQRRLPIAPRLQNEARRGR